MSISEKANMKLLNTNRSQSIINHLKQFKCNWLKNKNTQGKHNFSFNKVKNDNKTWSNKNQEVQVASLLLPTPLLPWLMYLLAFKVWLVKLVKR